MPIFVRENKYLTQAEVCSSLGISRQTLWRWAKAGDIPKGSRLRKKQRIFTEDEFLAIEAYAQEVVPIDEGEPSQMRLQLLTQGDED